MVRFFFREQVMQAVAPVRPEERDSKNQTLILDKWYFLSPVPFGTGREGIMEATGPFETKRDALVGLGVWAISAIQETIRFFEHAKAADSVATQSTPKDKQ